MVDSGKEPNSVVMNFPFMEHVKRLMAQCLSPDDTEWLFVCQSRNYELCESAGSQFGTEFLNTRAIVEAFDSFIYGKLNNEASECVQALDNELALELRQCQMTTTLENKQSRFHRSRAARKNCSSSQSARKGIGKNGEEIAPVEIEAVVDVDEYENTEVENDMDYDTDDTVDLDFNNFETEKIATSIFFTEASHSIEVEQQNSDKQSKAKEVISDLDCNVLDDNNSELISDENLLAMKVKFENLNTLRAKCDSEIIDSNSAIKKPNQLQRFDKEQIECSTANTTCNVCFKTFTSTKALRGHFNAHRNKELIKVDKTSFDQSQLKCGKCGKKFLLESQLNSHLSLTKSCRNKEVSLRESLPVELIKYRGAANGEEREITVWDLLQSVELGCTNCKCIICQKVLKTSNNLLYHIMSTHSEAKPHSCKFCSRSFRYELTMDNHMLAVHKNHLTYVSCDLCNKKCLSEEKLIIHKSFKCPRRVKQIFKCETCGFTARARRQFEGHLQSHAGIKEFTCEICGKKLSTKSSLNSHYQTVHTTETPFKCSNCEDCFKTQAQVRLHQQTKHDKPKFHCEICNRSFQRSSYFKTHAVYHTNERPFTCEVCGKGFRQKESLTVHQRFHTGEKPFKCSKCNASFRSRPHLVGHERIHSPGNHICEICGKVFKQLPKLQAHKKLHTKDITNRLYTCNYCYNNYETVSKYKTHIAKVHPEKTAIIESSSDMRFHKCAVCPKIFSWVWPLKKHMETHDKKPFICTICLKLFVSKPELDMHIKRRHSVKETMKTTDQAVGSSAPIRCTRTDSLISPKQDFKAPITVKNSRQGSKRTKGTKKKNPKKMKRNIKKPKSRSIAKTDAANEEYKDSQFTAFCIKDIVESPAKADNDNSGKSSNTRDRNVSTRLIVPIDNNVVLTQTLSTLNLERETVYPGLLKMLSTTSSQQYQAHFPNL